MIKYFANNNPLVLILVPIITILHFALDFYFPGFGNLVVGQDNLWQIDFSLLSPIFSKILSFLFVCLNAYLINHIFNSIEFYERLTFLPSILYLLLILLFPISLNFGEGLIAQTLFILAFYKLLSFSQKEDARNDAFLSGFFLGLAASFIPLYSVFLVIIYFALFTTRPYVWREHLLPVIGFLFPSVWIFYLNPTFYESLLSFNLHFEIDDISAVLLIIPSATVIVLTLIAHKKVLEKRLKSSIRFKRINSITLFAFIVAVAFSTLMILVANTFFYFTICVAILPLILPYTYLNPKKKWLSYGLFYLLFAINIIKFFY